MSLPSCAQSCVTEATSGTNIGGCNAVDVACICSNPSFLSGIACCVAGVCDQADQESTIQYAVQLCDTVGVTNLPSLATCASTAASTSSTSSTIISNSIPTSSSATLTTTGLSLSSATKSPTGSSGSTGSTSTSSSTGSPSPSTSTAGHPNSNPGLSAGAKAGIAVGAVVGVLLVLLLAFFFLRQHRKPKSKPATGSEDAVPRDTESDPAMLELPAEKPIQIIRATEMPALPPLHPELPAEKPIRSIPRKELPTRANDLELETSPMAAELQSQTWDGTQGSDTRELETSPSAAELRGSAWEVPKQTSSQPFQPLPVDPYNANLERAAEANAPLTHGPESSRTSSQTLLSDTSTSASSSRMDELRAKRDKIRVEKERLLKLQELDEMEAAVQREMLEEAKKLGGNIPLPD